MKLGNRINGEIKGQALQCSHSGFPLSIPTTCKGSSRKTNYCFRVYIYRKRQPQTPQPHGIVVIECPVHNLEAFKHPSTHPRERTSASEEIASILSLIQAGIPPSRIITASYQENEHMNALPQGIYNLRTIHRAVMLAGRTPLQTL